MKKIAPFLTFAGLLILIQFSCKKNNDPVGNPKGFVTKTSECKLKSSELKNITAATESCIVYDYFETTNVLKIWHHDAAFNCGMTKVTSDVSVKNDTLFISETETAQPANCDCLYDIEIEVRELKSGKYTISIIEPYVGDQQKLIFSVDLDKDPSGTHCVPRSNYPWGI